MSKTTIAAALLGLSLAAAAAPREAGAVQIFGHEYLVAPSGGGRVRVAAHRYHRFAARAGTHDAGMSSGVSAAIADAVSRRIGAQWVPIALHIARIESGGRCSPGGNGGGIFQVADPRRFGVSRAAVTSCAGGIAAGVAHMASCIARGAHTPAMLAVCHNTGSPFSRRVERAYRRFVGA